MTSIKYDDIFERFLGYITDYQLASLDISDAIELMSEYLNKTISDSYINSLFSSISLDNEIQILSYELINEVSENADLNFVINILSKGMVVEWLQPQVKSKANLAQMFTGKEAKFYSQSNHISELRGMLEDARLDVRKIIRDRGYINNPYLES